MVDETIPLNDRTQEPNMDQDADNDDSGDEVDHTQKFTQEAYDPRRSGRNNSGLNEADLSDVLCILHPASPMAYKVVASTALRNAQHILQNRGLVPLERSSDIPVTEQQTILADEFDVDNAQDIALRFSSRVNDPAVGFCFGRNLVHCDIILEMGTSTKKISNKHFRIYANEDGVFMLEDMSQNGTLVDDKHLKGKLPGAESSRMLNQGSIIQILAADPNEILKFIVRYPSRHGHVSQYETKFKTYMAHVKLAEQRAQATKQDPPMPDAAARGHLAAPLIGPPNPKTITAKPFLGNHNYGMQWNGDDKYRAVGLLGKGAFATVYQIATTNTGQCYAAKELEKKRFMKNGILDLKLDNEMQIMQGLRHPNIVQYVDYKEDNDHLYIIMEYVPGGDLQGYMHAHGTLPEPLAKEMTLQVLSSLAYLHQKHITHRDIKPDNILIASEDPFVVKLTDFGLSKVVVDQGAPLTTFCGTLLYCAPEVFPHYDNYVSGRPPKRRRQESNSKRRAYDQSVDIWSYAAVLWFVLCGKPPIEGVVDATGKGMFTKIMETQLDTLPLKERGVSAKCIDLLVRMLNTDPAARPTEQECLQHPWLNNGVLSDQNSIRNGLGPILEEGEELDASQLSIHDNSNDESKDENDGDSFDFAEARKSKRFKVDDESRATSNHDLFTSSEFSSLHSIPLVNNVVLHGAAIPRSKPDRLFGEISQTALKSSGVLGIQPTSGLTFARESEVPTGNNQTDFQPLRDGHENGSNSNRDFPQSNGLEGVRADASLLGAESLVRELNMESPEASHIARMPTRESTSPKTPAGSFNPSVGNPNTPTPRAKPASDVTPKQPSYNRQISLPMSTSLFYDGREPSSRPLDQTNKPNQTSYPQGIMFPNVSLPAPSATSINGQDHTISSLPETVTTSYPSSTSAEQRKEVPADNHANKENEDYIASIPTPESAPAALLPAASFLKPTSRYGKLVSTADSFAALTLPLCARFTNWGRNPNNSLVYADARDTRIPKQAWEVWFHARDIAAADAAGADWTGLPGLHAVIRTHSRRGLWVNGVHLRACDERGRWLYGRVHDGDVVVVSAGEGGRLAFVVHLFCGAGAKRREAGAPRFDVQVFEEEAGA